MTRTDQQHGWRVVGAIIFASVTLHGSGHAQAREREFAVALVGGLFQYDLSLSANGTSAFGAVRVDVPLTRRIILEPGLTFAQYDPQFGSRARMLFPEAQLQVSGTGNVRPFLGVGLGPALVWWRGSREMDPAVSAALGLRIRMTSDWRARAELRVRAIDPFGGTIKELGFGIGRSF